MHIVSHRDPRNCTFVPLQAHDANGKVVNVGDFVCAQWKPEDDRLYPAKIVGIDRSGEVKIVVVFTEFDSKSGSFAVSPARVFRCGEGDLVEAYTKRLVWQPGKIIKVVSGTIHVEITGSKGTVVRLAPDLVRAVRTIEQSAALSASSFASSSTHACPSSLCHKEYAIVNHRGEGDAFELLTQWAPKGQGKRCQWLPIAPFLRSGAIDGTAYKYITNLGLVKKAGL